MGAVELTYLTLDAVTIYSVMEVAFGRADEHLYAFDIIGQEPNQSDGEYRNLTVSLREKPVYQFTAAQTLCF